MPIRGEKGSGAPATASDLESLAIKGRVRAEGVDLSPAEGKILQDPDWITEDEADAIMAERIYRREADRAKPLREYLRERGITVIGRDHTARRRRSGATPGRVSCRSELAVRC